MNKEKKKLLELAINHYGLNSSSDVYNMIERQRATNLQNGKTSDYFTHLPKKKIKDNTYIQIAGTECNDIVLVSTGDVGVFLNSFEIKKGIRRMKVKKIFVK